MTLGPRVVIIGNSGSGKTTLARAIAGRMDVPVTGLDRVHWQGQVLVQRDEQAAIAMVAELAAGSCWVIEGVYGWLAAVALPFATGLVWLDMPWSVCSDGLASRGPWTGATADQHASFLAWAEAYWQRATPTSFAGHLALFDHFSGEKRRLQQRSDVTALLGKAD
jgi:adenylate kinase family enzyme